MSTMDELRRRAKAEVQAVWEDPQGRIALREDFYESCPGTGKTPPGLGLAELDFVRWMANRGVLAADGGSRWWKEVNGLFCYWGQLARLAFENGMAGEDWETPVRHWLDYMTALEAKSWYRAHNTSILQAYLDTTDAAKNESFAERRFMNMVLYRVIYAQAMVMGVTGFGRLGEILADPSGESVAIITHVPDFYPMDYELTGADFLDIMGLNRGLEEMLVRFLDDDLLHPQLRKLYAEAAVWNDLPEIPLALSVSGQPIYPMLREPIAPANKKRIVILGGGLGALASAWELTQQPGWEQRYSIDIYQLGWRCGGKMRGGRGVNGRVEEIGLHLLLGFYELAWPMYAQAWSERASRGLAPDASYTSLDDALDANMAVLMVSFDKAQHRWRNWPLIFPPSPGTPGDGHRLGIWQMIKRGVGILLEVVLGSPYAPHVSKLVTKLLGDFFPADGGTPDAPLVESHHHGLITGFFSELGALMDGTLLGLAKVVRWVLRQVTGAGVDPYSHWGHLLMFADFGGALLEGLMADVWDPTTKTFRFHAINNQDFRVWLRGHGAQESTLYGPIITFFYQATFEGLADGQQQGGLLAAGSACQFLLPAVGYKGNFMNQLRLGTADTLVMPLYQVLAARGVNVHFFHELTDITVADGAVTAVSLTQQVKLADPSVPYDPVITVGGNPCWPNAPRYEQLDPAQAALLQANDVDLESAWKNWDQGTPVVLTTADFDSVILAIPPAAQKQCAPSLLASDPSWATMCARTPTAVVMSAQLWLEDDLAGLGYDHAAWGMAEYHCRPNVVTYANPLFSWLDQSQILEHEAWPTPAPQTLAMYLGTMPDLHAVPPFTDHSWPQRQLDRARDLTWQWLMDNSGWFFPDAAPPAYPAGLDLGRLAATVPGTVDGKALYAQQYFSVAVNPSDQYVIACPGTGAVRKKPAITGYSNLFIAGDWTDYGANIGFMEGVCESAHQAVDGLLASFLFDVPKRWRDPHVPPP